MQKLHSIAAIILILLAQPAIGAEINGRVVGITDGDTLKVLTPAHQQIKIRLAEIDAPEHDQPYGSGAKQALSALAFDKTVSIEDEGKDRYGRTIGLIHAGEENVNAELVREGAAWVYTKYNHDPALPPVEAEARAAKRGLWALPEAQRMPPWEWLQFAKEYIRELAATENLRVLGEQELKDGSDKMMTCIRNSTAFQLELGSQISMMNGMHLNAPLDSVPQTIVQIYRDKIDQYNKLSDLCSSFVGGPREGMDYGRLAAEMPKITAQMRYIDHTMFDVSQLVFASLIDERPDSKNHLNHLVITKAERKELIDDIDAGFGDKLSRPLAEQTEFVASASLLKSHLQDGHKCSDDPWQ